MEPNLEQKLNVLLNPTPIEIKEAHDYFINLGGKGIVSRNIIIPPERGTSDFYKMHYHTLVACYVANEMLAKSKSSPEVLSPYGRTGVDCAKELLGEFSSETFGLDKGTVDYLMERHSPSGFSIGYEVEKIIALLRDYIHHVNQNKLNARVRVRIKVASGNDECV